MKYSLLLVIALSLLNSCGKSGCTDEQALNYDAGAKFDDGSCTYFAEQFAGNYVATDSFNTKFGTNYIVGRHHFDFTIRVFSRNYMGLLDFPQAQVSQYLTLKEREIILSDSVDYPIVRRQYFNFQPDTLFYDVVEYDSTILINRNWGFAIKNQ
jgi:hypothetical protein